MKRYSKEEINELLKQYTPCRACGYGDIRQMVPGEYCYFHQIISQLLSDNEEMEKALEFYAKKETYERWYSKVGEERKNYPSDANIDFGHIARATLEKIK